MNETGIEWVLNPDGSQGYTWNPITGCLNHDNGLCRGGGFPCYAYKLANGRLKSRYLANTNIARSGYSIPKRLDELPMDESDPFYPRFWEERLDQILHRRIDSELKGVFCCDMSDLFGIGIPEDWTKQILAAIEANFYDRFYLLTKQPQNLIKFSPFPENAWVGVTATNEAMFSIASNQLAQINARKKFYSFEPLLSWDFKADWDKWNKCLIDRLKAVDWLIIGACTGTYKDMLALHVRLHGGTPANQLMRLENGMYSLQPPIEWLREIVETADKAGIKVFLKDNLVPSLYSHSYHGWAWTGRINPKLRQEMPA